MGFERIRVNAASVGTGVKVSLSKGKTSPAKMAFAINAATAARFGWSAGDKLEVMLGNDEHHGLIRFRKNNSVGDAVVTAKKAAHDSTYMYVGLGHQPGFVDRKEPPRWCQFKIVDDWIEVQLPRWAYETAAKKPVDAPIVPSIALARGRDVTSAIMGDPPPGRRETLARIGQIKA